MKNVDVAIELIQMGLGVFPCDAEKHPLTAHGFRDASIDETTIRNWWNKHPEAIPAIWPGTSGLVVIDCDVKDGKTGPDNFEQLCVQHNIDQSNFFSVKTPSGGFHLYFKSRIGYSNSHSLPSDIDLRSVGGYVIAPGAPGYKIVAGTWETIPSLPEALAALLKPADAQTGLNPLSLSAERPGVTEREKQYAETALEDECAKLSVMRPGSGRNDALNRASHSIGTMIGAGWINAETTVPALLNAATINGHVAKHGKRQTHATIESGLNAGIAKPRAPLPAVEIPEWINASIANWIAAFKAKQSHQTNSLFEFLENIKSLQDYDIRPLAYLVDGMIPESSIVMLSGGPGCGKSTLAMKIAYLASQGLPIFGTQQTARRVLYLDRDNAPAIVKDRMARLHMTSNRRFKYWGGHLGVDVPKRIFAETDFIRWMDAETIKPILVIDSQIAFQEGKETDSNDIRAFYDPLRQLTNRGVTVIVIHHTGKGESTREFRGSEDIRAALDVGYVVNNSSKVGLNKITLNAFKARVIVEEEIALTYDNGEFIPQNLRHAKEDNLMQLLKTNSGVTKKEFESIAMEKHFSRSDIRNFIDTGIGFGTVLARRGERNASLLYHPENISLAN